MLPTIFTHNGDGYERGALSYLRAQSIAKKHALTIEDINHLSKAFWALHTDPLLCIDSSATTLLTIQYNLVVGTIAPFAEARPELRPLLQDLVDFKILGHFCLTEVGHGLDAVNLETTATLTEEGGFILHTRSPEAAKYMPPTVPALGRPAIAVVFARLFVGGEQRGVRPFLVPVNDGNQMCVGIEAKLLPHRGGSAPVNHAITSFNNVKLPSHALLGNIEMPSNLHNYFIKAIWRINIGALSLSMVAMAALKIAAYIGVTYSLRRKITSTRGKQVPIIFFRTQHLPVFTALANAYVLQAFYRYAIGMFMDEHLQTEARRGVSACGKALLIGLSQQSHVALSERCGAQGLFPYNQIILQHIEIKGISIAEGDVLVLCIRLATELLLGRYTLPQPVFPNSLLAKHEKGLFEEYKDILLVHGHRSSEYASHVLPRCQAMVEAIGYRMAYDAAVSEGLPDSLINLFLCNAIRNDLAWYVEKGILTHKQLVEIEDAAIQTATPHIQQWVEGLEVEPFVVAPIVHDKAWKRFTEDLKTFQGSSAWSWWLAEPHSNPLQARL